jgi:hypothetical protein
VATIHYKAAHLQATASLTVCCVPLGDMRSILDLYRHRDHVPAATPI